MKSQQDLYRLIREHVVLRHWGSLKNHKTTMAYTRKSVVQALSSNDADCRYGEFSGELFQFSEGDTVIFGPLEDRKYEKVPFKTRAMLSCVCQDNSNEELVFPIAALRRRAVKPLDEGVWKGILERYPSHRKAIMAPMGHLEYYASIPEGTFTVHIETVMDQTRAKDGTVVSFERRINILLPATREKSKRKM